jgi:hypothetical protein
LVCKNGDLFKVCVRSKPCLVAGKPARLVVLSKSEKPTPALDWTIDWQEDFFPEESPAPIPEYGRC